MTPNASAGSAFRKAEGLKDQGWTRAVRLPIHPSSFILHPFLRPSACCYRLRFLGSITAARPCAAFPGCEASGNAGPAWGRRKSGRGDCPRPAFRARREYTAHRAARDSAQEKETGDGGPSPVGSKCWGSWVVAGGRGGAAAGDS